MDSPVITDAFALEDVVIGGGPDWVRASVAGRRAGQRRGLPRTAMSFPPSAPG